MPRKLKRPTPLKALFPALAAAVLIGLPGQFLFPDTLRLSLAENLLTPLYDAFLGLLRALSGPLIFLSVLGGICGMGDTAALGRVGRRMLLRFLLLLLLWTTLAAALLWPFFRPAAGESAVSTSDSGVLELVLDILPDNLLAPFLTGNSLQLIVLAAAFGAALLVLGPRAQELRELAEQSGEVVQWLIGRLGAILPLFIFLALLLQLWSGAPTAAAGIWQPLLLITGVVLLYLPMALLWTAKRRGFSPLQLAKTLLPTFLIALTTASSAAAYDSNLRCCREQLGMEGTFARFGLSMGIVVYMPGTAVTFLCCALYAAELWPVPVSLGWLCTAVLLSVILAVATPPVPGGGLACYAALFAQLGIPEEALAIAATLEILSDFVVTAANQTLLQTELLLQSK